MYIALSYAFGHGLTYCPFLTTAIVQAKRRCQRHIRQLAVGIKVEAQFSQATRKAWVKVSNSKDRDVIWDMLQLGICYGNSAPHWRCQRLSKSSREMITPAPPPIQPALFWTMFQMVFFHFLHVPWMGSILLWAFTHFWLLCDTTNKDSHDST